MDIKMFFQERKEYIILKGGQNIPDFGQRLRSIPKRDFASDSEVFNFSASLRRALGVQGSEYLDEVIGRVLEEELAHADGGIDTVLHGDARRFEPPLHVLEIAAHESEMGLSRAGSGDIAGSIGRRFFRQVELDRADLEPVTGIRQRGPIDFDQFEQARVKIAPLLKIVHGDGNMVNSFEHLKTPF